RAVCTGLAMGTGLTLLFALWPLLDVRRVPPALILRQDVEPRLPGRRPWLAALPIAIGLGALAVWEAGSLKVGAIFIGSLVAAPVARDWSSSSRGACPGCVGSLGARPWPTCIAPGLTPRRCSSPSVSL